MLMITDGMRFRGYNIRADSDRGVAEMLARCTVPVWTWAHPWRRFRAASQIEQAADGFVTPPFAIVRITRTIQIGADRDKKILPRGSIMVVGPRRIAVEIPEDGEEDYHREIKQPRESAA